MFEAWADPVKLVAWAKQATATEYASLAPAALIYAEAGDTFAEEIDAQGVRRVKVLIRSLLEFGVPRISAAWGFGTAFGTVAFT